jgi:two-component system phosphate regulon response regulator PhoB
MNNKILVVEDEPDIRELIAVNLRASHFQVFEASDVNQATKILGSDLPDLCIMDWMLPDQTGIYLLRKMKVEPMWVDIPVMMLTARSSEHDKVMALDLGADDYLTKPFSPRELIARSRVLLRRKTPLQSVEKLELGDLQACKNTMTIGSKDTSVTLHSTEFKLLWQLLSRPSWVQSRSQLIEQVWGRDAQVDERTVDAHIRRVRMQLAVIESSCLIETVRGEGYRLVFNSTSQQT